MGRTPAKPEPPFTVLRCYSSKGSFGCFPLTLLVYPTIHYCFNSFRTLQVFQLLTFFDFVQCPTSSHIYSLAIWPQARAFHLPVYLCELCDHIWITNNYLCTISWLGVINKTLVYRLPVCPYLYIVPCWWYWDSDCRLAGWAHEENTDPRTEEGFTFTKVLSLEDSRYFSFGLTWKLTDILQHMAHGHVFCCLPLYTHLHCICTHLTVKDYWIINQSN